MKDWSRINAIVGNPKPFFFKTWPPETEVLMLFAIVLELDPKDWRGSSDLSAEARQFLVDVLFYSLLMSSNSIKSDNKS